MSINTVLAVIPVAEFDVAYRWYEGFFGRPADLHPMEGLAEWRLTRTAWLQVFHDADRDGHTAVNFVVEELDGQLAGLAELGIAATEPLTVSNGRQRLATVTDPDGNQVNLIEILCTS